MCEDYLDPCLYDKCGTLTSTNVNCFDWVAEYAKLAINLYNEKEQKNFMLVKVEKLYSFVDPHYYCMTFWAQNGSSDEYRLFRAVCVKRDDKVLLCVVNLPSSLCCYWFTLFLFLVYVNVKWIGVCGGYQKIRSKINSNLL
ncbi:uncharacterized protein [Henckelia pumila]|uniref:uncharacterized protein n=1 Tax=Henckelia pumila TaxID=405737 RepID=UPI003C6E0923